MVIAMNNTPINYGRHKVDQADIDAVAEVLRSDFLTTGPLVEKFELALAHYFGNENVVVCNNGTSALFLAAKALGISENDVVIVPSQTFLATASAPHMLGAEVVFSDVDKDTGLMTPEDLLKAVQLARNRHPTKRLKAVFVVHLNGQVAYMPDLWKISKASGCVLIEDACHAIGASTCFDYNDAQTKVGKCEFSDAATFSFHPVKNLTTGEGGAVAFREDKHAVSGMLLRNHGLNKQDLGSIDASLAPTFSWSYTVVEPSLNFRLPDILCALGISQLQKLQNWVNKRAELWDIYESLIGVSGVVELVEPKEWCKPAWHLLAARVDFQELGKSRVEVFKYLNEKNIFPQVHYQPVHLQPYWINRYGRDELPNSVEYYNKIVSLPLFVDMTESDVKNVASAVLEAINH